jgi:hypothetical protein
MKISAAAMAQISHLGEKPILPLIPEKVKYDRSNSVAFKLRMTPADANSQTYELQVPMIKGSESVREVLDWRLKMNRVFAGMGANDGPSQMELVNRVVTDAATTVFVEAVAREQRINHRALRDAERDAAIANGDDRAEQDRRVAAIALPDIRTQDITRALNSIVEYHVPYKGLQRQKRWMRRKCRKPGDMTAREFFNHFNRINSLELPRLPPGYTVDQSLAPDEVADILLHAFPATWGAEMERQGFDPFTKTPQEILEFVERLEVAEQINNKVARGGKTTNTNSGSTQKKSGNNGSGKGAMFCHVHGKNSTHNTDQCRTIKGMKKKGENFSSEKKGNKSWTRKGEQAKYKTKNDLAALVRKTMREELNAMSKKDKSSDDDESVASVNQMDEKDEFDPASLNYNDMNDLSIESDDDGDANMIEEASA